VSVLELHDVEIYEIEGKEFFGVHGFQTKLVEGKPSAEAAESSPTELVEVEEDSFVEVLASAEKKERDQAEGTVAEPVPETAEMGLEDQSKRTVEETVHDVETPRTGAKPVLEKVEDRSGSKPDLMEVEEAVRAGDEPVRDAVEEKTGAEPVSVGVSLGAGDLPVGEVGEDDLFFEDYPGDDFEKVGEYTQEETSQTPLHPAPEHLTEPAPSSTEPRKKRIKTLAGRTDLFWV